MYNLLMQTDVVVRMQVQIIDETIDLLSDEAGNLAHQKAKLESQEQRDALIPGQCLVKIQELEGTENIENGKKVTYYLINISRTHEGTGWSVKRRYNDFEDLHLQLLSEIEFVSYLELPGKTLGLWSSKSKEAKTSRLIALEKYLQVQNPNLAIN
jgi:hypothetical protein